MMTKHEDQQDESNFFKSIAHKYVFALLYTDGNLRMNLLGISKLMYYNEKLATEWRDAIRSYINPISCNVYGVKEANENLMKLYDGMVMPLGKNNALDDLLSGPSTNPLVTLFPFRRKEDESDE